MIRTAKAVADEVPAARQSSIGALARLNSANSERDTHRLTKKFQLTIPLELSPVQVGDLTLGFLRMSSWASFVQDNNLWHHLTGLEAPDHDRCAAIWSTFWTRFKGICPEHEIFKRSDPEFCFSRCCALLLHGDEGVSAKKSAILVVSCHSVLGHGISTATERKEAAKYEAMRLNYSSPTWTTRFLIGVMPKHVYSNDDGEETTCFQDFLRGITQDLKGLFEDGIVNKSGRRWLYCVINLMGDWPWLVKSGTLGRSFYNTAKRASSKAAPKGICHMCMADMDGYPWEDWQSATPKWVASINKKSPFLGTPALLDLPKDPTDLPALWAWDLFHTWHLGCGRTFLSSCIAVLASSALFEGSIDTRLSTVSDLFENWCKENHCLPQLRRFTKAKLAWMSNADYPHGTWGKGNDTTIIMKWFLEQCSKFGDKIQNSGDDLLPLAVEAAAAANRFLSGVYRQEVWIAARDASRLANFGLLFLSKHGQCVRQAFRSNRHLFLQMPNLHRFHHTVLALKWQGERSKYALNPLALASQADEDYIGRPSRISRHVHARTVVRRALQRGLEAAHDKYVEQGLLIPDRA